MKELSQGLENRQVISGNDFKGYFVPESIDRAIELLVQYGEEIKVLAGGTDLLVQYYESLDEIKGWLDLRKIKELKGINLDEDRLEIGAMVTHSQLEESENIKKYFPILNQAAAEIGSPQIRNRGTIGGNVVNASPAGDLLPALLAYDAEFKILSSQGEVTIPAAEFFIGPKKTILKSNQLLVQIILPIPGEKTYGSWNKIGKRKALSISTITLALVVKIAEDNQTIKEGRVCLGSVAATPIEIKEIREKMRGQQLDQLDFVELGQFVADRISPIDDLRGTKEYRKDVAKNIMIKALEDIKMDWGRDNA